MVKLQEVEDEHFTQDQPAPSGSTALPKDVLLADEEDDDMAYSDTGMVVAFSISSHLMPSCPRETRRPSTFVDLPISPTFLQFMNRILTNFILDLPAFIPATSPISACSTHFQFSHLFIFHPLPHPKLTWKIQTPR